MLNAIFGCTNDLIEPFLLDFYSLHDTKLVIYMVTRIGLLSKGNPPINSEMESCAA